MKRGRKNAATQHALIQGLADRITEMTTWPEVKKIIPGRINRTSTSQGGLTIRVVRDTTSGLQCRAASGMGVQDLFITTTQKRELRRRLGADAA
jgi:hypothetical protein